VSALSKESFPMKRFLTAIDWVSEKSGKGVSFLILLLSVVVLYEIVARYLFNSPTIWAHEIAQMIFGTYVILMGAYVLKHGSHVNVESLYNRFSPRTRAILDLFTWSLFFIFCGLIFWKGAGMAWDSFVVLETGPTSFAPPIYPFKAMIPLGALLILLQGLAKYLRCFLFVITGKEDGE
jgi:TRAP-type mannitol/chloroaromatic compound transport system permease small subunit